MTQNGRIVLYSILKIDRNQVSYIAKISSFSKKKDYIFVKGGCLSFNECRKWMKNLNSTLTNEI